MKVQILGFLSRNGGLCPPTLKVGAQAPLAALYLRPCSLRWFDSPLVRSFAFLLLFPFISFFMCSFSFSVPPPNHPITKGKISTMKPPCLLRISNANCWYFCNFSLRFSAMFAFAGQAISSIQIIRSSASSSVRSGLLVFVVFLILYSKFHISFLSGFLMTVPFFHVVLYQTVLSSSKPASFPHSTTSTIKGLCYAFSLTHYQQGLYS